MSEFINPMEAAVAEFEAPEPVTAGPLTIYAHDPKPPVKGESPKDPLLHARSFFPGLGLALSMNGLRRTITYDMKRFPEETVIIDEENPENRVAGTKELQTIAAQLVNALGVLPQHYVSVEYCSPEFAAVVRSVGAGEHLIGRDPKSHAYQKVGLAKGTVVDAVPVEPEAV